MKTNDRIALIDSRIPSKDSPRGLNIKTFDTPETLLDEALALYYVWLRRRFNIKPDLVRIINQRINKHLKAIMKKDPGLHEEHLSSDDNSEGAIFSKQL